MSAPVIAEHDVTVYLGDVRERLAELPARSVQCCVTSPPYYGLRDYGVDGQIGLEPSPGEYVAEMVAVFAGVRRVLADDGVLWLNLGDSYSTPIMHNDNAHNANRVGGSDAKARAMGDAMGRRKRPMSLPAKNLLGIPWRVAKALQAPRYVGNITSDADRAWLAAMLDGEGCIAVHKRPAGSSQYRRNDTYAPMVQISNTCLPLLERCKQITGVGSISHSDRGRNRRIYRYCVMANDARQLLRELYPHMIAKQAQARAAVAMPSSGPDAERAWLEGKALNHGGAHDGGWPVPASMFEPGWILRNAVIWSKPNAMPESVTDRLSTRYEHVFLFSKSRRYWFDLDAIREERSRGERLDAVQTGARKGHVAAGPSDRLRSGSNPTSVWNTGVYQSEGRNPGDVWTIATSPFPGAHFATMPPELARRCILAGCPESGTVLDPFTGIWYHREGR
jgi:DNA modification methylase